MISIIGFLILINTIHAFAINNPTRLRMIMNKCSMNKNPDTNVKMYWNEITNKNNELNTMYPGEVNKKDELMKHENEYFKLYQKMQKHNKKKIYKSEKRN